MALTSIDVGAAVIERATAAGHLWTRVTQSNPANASGYITVVSLYNQHASSTMSQIEVASFSADGDDLTTNEYVSLADAPPAGVTTYRAPIDFTPFAISSGEYIGIYYVGGAIAIDAAGGGGCWHKNSDEIPCTSELFTDYPGEEISLYATGYDEIKGWINVGDVWKLIDTWQINIGDVWKTVSNVQENISDAWKETWLT